MTNFFIRRLGAMYAHQIGQWLAVMITMAVIKTLGLLALKYPPIAAGCDPVAISNWIIGFVAAPLINTIANTIATSNASEGQVVAEVAADLKTEPATAKAQFSK